MEAQILSNPSLKGSFKCVNLCHWDAEEALPKKIMAKNIPGGMVGLGRKQDPSNETLLLFIAYITRGPKVTR